MVTKLSSDILWKLTLYLSYSFLIGPIKLKSLIYIYFNLYFSFLYEKLSLMNF